MHRCCTAIAALLAAAPPALADDLGSREHQAGVVTKVDQGVFQLGLDSVFILGVQSEGEESTSRLNTTVNVMFRYFVRDNTAVSVRAGWIYRENGDVADSGLLGMAWVNQFMRLGDGIFFSPGLGAGMVLATRELPDAAGVVMESNVVAGATAVELPLSVFLGPRLSVSAGPELLLSFGTATPEAGEGQSFVALDGGFKVGAIYSY